MARTRVSAKGQVVIPKQLRDELGWKPGKELSVQREGMKLVLQPTDAERHEAVRRFRQLRGTLKGYYTMERYVADKRAEIELEARPEFGGR